MKKKTTVEKKEKLGCCTRSNVKPKGKIKAKVKIKSKKRVVAKVAIDAKPEGKLIGKITHYFANIKVGVIALTKPLSVGDEIRIIGGNDTDFNQEVKSMEEEHVKLKTAKSGLSVGLKVIKPVREGYKVFKV